MRSLYLVQRGEAKKLWQKKVSLEIEGTEKNCILLLTQSGA